MSHTTDHGMLAGLPREAGIPVEEGRMPRTPVPDLRQLRGEEAHVGSILSAIAATRAAILEHGGGEGTPLRKEDCVFLSFWDFDGTILKGDCCEGHRVDGKVLYTGLLEETVRAGFSLLYPSSEDGVQAAIGDYDRMNREVGAKIAYPHLALLMAGACEREVLELAGRHFRQHQRQWLFRSSLRIMQDLEASGVEVHVISASPDLYIRALASEMGWRSDRCRGIRVGIQDGRLSDQLVHPVTYAEGKTEALIEQVAAASRLHPGKQVFVLAGFGNNHDTDGHFLRHIAGQTLPAGRPVTVMINAEPRDGEAFIHVTQEAV